MAINFPTSPALNDVYTFGSRSWKWNGSAWVATGQQPLGTADIPQFAGINLGHASDTTLARSAAGIITVEGKEIIAPASAAQGDIVYHNGTNWVRLAAGTSGQFLKTLGANANPAWAGGSAFTLLGTMTTTSGASQTLSSLTLTNYKFLFLMFRGISISADQRLNVAGVTMTPILTASATYYGHGWIDLSNGHVSMSFGGENLSTAGGGASGYSTATTSITIGPASGNWDAGSIPVYGVA